jgi:hypothetical protein
MDSFVFIIFSKPNPSHAVPANIHHYPTDLLEQFHLFCQSHHRLVTFTQGLKCPVGPSELFLSIFFRSNIAVYLKAPWRSNAGMYGPSAFDDYLPAVCPGVPQLTLPLAIFENCLLHLVQRLGKKCLEKVMTYLPKGFLTGKSVGLPGAFAPEDYPVFRVLYDNGIVGQIDNLGFLPQRLVCLSQRARHMAHLKRVQEKLN